jgi:hypothetical protein
LRRRVRRIMGGPRRELLVLRCKFFVSEKSKK